MNSPTPDRLRLPRLGVLLLVLVGGCVDAPSAPENGFGLEPLLFAPRLSLLGPDGALASASQTDALNEAFDRVDRFRMTVRRASDNRVVVDTFLAVTPGQDTYDLSVPIAATPNDQYYLSLIALQGDLELFAAPFIPVEPIRLDASGNPIGGSGGQPTTTNIALRYSGPGATAASVDIGPDHSVLGPGSSTAFSAVVRGPAGDVVAGVPAAWSSSRPQVATVDRTGRVSALADGATFIAVGTPNGLEATATVYVVGGTLAYVEGGQVRSRPAVGGSATDRGGAGNASAPAWSPDGGTIYYAEGGSVRAAGDGTPILDGGWPSISPDGTKLAVENGGRVVFANRDGSNATDGPAGTTPVWTDDASLLVGGGSVQRVRADDTGRATVASGSAGLPSVGPGGEVAFVDGGSLYVLGVGQISNAAAGRASWSPSGRMLVVQTGSGFAVVPADGSAPPVALPGFEGAAYPAFQSGGPLASSAVLGLTGFDPDPPIPGQPTTLRGSGFDWIIPSNNVVSWPTSIGIEEAVPTMVTASALTSTMPRTVVPGQVRVRTKSGSAVLELLPTLGAIELSALAYDGAAVAGLEAVLRDPAGNEVGRTSTDPTGAALFSGLLPGQYRLELRPPDGFALEGLLNRTVAVGTQGVLVELRLTPVVAAVDASPADPTLAVGEQVAVTVTAVDILGRPITSFARTFWGAGSAHLAAGGAGLEGTIAGVYPSAPGGATFNVALNSEVFPFQATVTSHIEGTITQATQAGVAPKVGHVVALEQAGQASVSVSTDHQGKYRFDGLLAGTYTVRPAPATSGSVSPATRTITLGPGTPFGTADFSISSGGTQAFNFRVLIFSGGHTNNNATILSNAAALWPDIQFDVAFGSPPSQATLALYAVVWLYENGGFSTSTQVGDALALYVQNGGNLVVGTFFWQDSWGTLGPLVPFSSVGGSEYSPDTLDPASIVAHPLTSGVSTLSVGDYQGGVAVRAGATVVANWADGTPLIGYATESLGQRLVAVSVFPGYGDFCCFSGDFWKIWENALRWAAASGSRSSGLPALTGLQAALVSEPPKPSATFGQRPTGTRGGR